MILREMLSVKKLSVRNDKQEKLIKDFCDKRNQKMLSEKKICWNNIT